MTRKGREKTMISKFYCFHKEPREGPRLMFAVSQSLSYTCCCSKTPLTTKPMSPPGEGCLEEGMSLFIPLPCLRPEQLKNSDVALWFYSKHPCSCGHGALSVSESDSE